VFAIGVVLIALGLLDFRFGTLFINRYHGSNRLRQRLEILGSNPWPPRYDRVAVRLRGLGLVGIGVALVILDVL
jgi:hypothetical protein